MFQDHEFALDPTDPRFATSKKDGAKSSLKDMSKKRSKVKGRGERMQDGDEPPVEKVRSKVAAAPAKMEVDGGVDQWDLKHMVSKLKRKAEKN